MSTRRAYEWPRFAHAQIHLQFGSHSLDAFQEYAEEVEHLLERQAREVHRDVVRRAERIRAERRQQFVDDMGEEIARFTEAFPELFRKSLFAQCASEFERILLAIAKGVSADLGTACDMNSVRGSGLDKTNTFFREYARLPFPNATREWNDIRFLNRIRNLVIHSDGFVPLRQRGSLATGIARWTPEIQLDNGGDLKFSRGFVPRVIDGYRRFLKQIGAALK